jgi:glycosyltransferase involved in cell wall biosynthesis
MRLSILTNMVAPYRVPLFKAMAADPRIRSLRVLTCVECEVDRQWQVESDSSYTVSVLPGFTLNLKRSSDAMRIIHLRLGIFWELLRRRPDTLVIGDASWTSFMAALACKAYRVPYVVWNEITTTSQVSKGAVAHLRRWMYRGARRLIASCSMAKDYLLQNGVPAERVYVVLNAVDNDFFLQQRERWEPKREELRAELGVAKDAFCFIYVGQLISRKRVVETVELLAQVAKERPIHLLVAGTGPLESEMRTCAANYDFTAISFCGYSKPERLSQLYVAADALILISKDEPWGMVINEAMIFNKPFLATTSVAAAVEFYEYGYAIPYQRIIPKFVSRHINGNMVKKKYLLYHVNDMSSRFQSVLFCE